MLRVKVSGWEQGPEWKMFGKAILAASRKEFKPVKFLTIGDLQFPGPHFFDILRKSGAVPS